MCLDIDGVRYFSTAEVISAANITRQTLWRWRQERKVPWGNRFRNGQVLFTDSEYQEILAFANRIDPEAPTIDPSQLPLFKGA